MYVCRSVWEREGGGEREREKATLCVGVRVCM